MVSYETLPVSPIWGAEKLIRTRPSSTPNHLNPWLLCFELHHPPPNKKKKKSGQINKVKYAFLWS